MGSLKRHQNNVATTEPGRRRPLAHAALPVGDHTRAALHSGRRKCTFDVSSSEPTKDSSKGSINLTFSESPGQVIVYKGELPSARDFTEATKVIVPVAPTSVQISFDMDSTGGILGTPSGDEDYVENNPWQLWPPLMPSSLRLTPFAP